MNAAIRVGALLLLFSVSALTAAAQMQATVAPSKDNTLYESATGSVSNGAGQYFFAGLTNRNEIRRALLAFDVAGSVPAGATIDSVKLTLSMSKTISGSLPATLHRVSRNWGEGSSNAASNEGGGVTATAGDATWIHAVFDTQTWSTPGGDYSPTASASASVGGVGSYTWGSSAGMVADVQAWLDDAANNFGWILIGDEATMASAKRYDSREGTNPPQLQIFYSLSTATEDAPETPSSVSLLSSYPNPFTHSTTVEYTVSEARDVRLDVYDTLGRRITTLANGFHPVGHYSAVFIAADLPAGVYFYRMESGEYSRYRQVVVIR